MLVEAGTLFEAAAAGLEQMDKVGGRLGEVEIIVHEPASRKKVRPEQLAKWLSQRDSADNIGIQALKSRVKELLSRRNAPQILGRKS